MRPESWPPLFRKTSSAQIADGSAAATSSATQVLIEPSSRDVTILDQMILVPRAVRQICANVTANRRSCVDWLRTLLETSPMTTLFLVIAAGYLVGEVNIKGFALGSGAVLFVGLACGAFAPKAAPPGMLGTLGLLLFLYCVGIQYGGEWYRGLTSPSGLRANAAALCGLAASAAVALAIQRTGAAGLPESLGMFAGATTSTPALQAVLDALGNQDAAVGYSLAYPLGVAGPILCMYVYLAIFKPKIAAPADRLMKPVEVRVRNATLIGRRFVDLQQSLPKGVQAVAIRSGGQNRVPDPTTILQADDVRPARRERSCGDWTGARVGRRSGRVDRGGSNRARLHPCLRVQGRRRGNAPRQPETSRRLRLQLHPRATG